MILSTSYWYRRMCMFYLSIKTLSSVAAEDKDIKTGGSNIHDGFILRN